MSQLTPPPNGVGVDIDVTQLRSTLKRVAPDLEKELRQNIKRLGIQARNEVKAGAPVLSGRLKRGIGVRTQFTQSKTRVTVIGKLEGGVRYYWLQEHGTKNFKPHKQYVKPAADKAARDAQPGVQKAIDIALREMSGG
jgi:hypothetical protein